MTTDIRFIVNTAKRNTSHFSIQTSGNGVGNGGFTNTGRANQTNNLRRHLRRHLPHRQSFQNALLHLLHAKMVLVKDFSGGSNIDPFLCIYIPGKFQKCIQIIPKNRSL